MNSLIKKINGYIRNIVIISLSFFMCANVLYTDVFAYDDDFQDNYVLNKIEDNDLDYDDIAYELIDKREGNKRYFKMNDGSTISCVYDHTVAIQDDEIGFYYLSSRYYDSNIGRFITKDDIEYLGVSATTVSYNLYAYCLNNPVNRIDTEGNFSVEICVLIGFAVGVIYSAIDDYKDDHKLNASIGGKTYLENIVFGVVAGYCFGNIGAIIYEAVPSLISFSSSFFTMGTAIGVSSSAATLTSSVTITCADILIGTGVAEAAAGINMVLSKGYQRDKMGNNQRENKMFNNFVNKYHISDKDLIRRLHDNLVKYKKAKNVTFEKYKDLEYFL